MISAIARNLLQTFLDPHSVELLSILINGFMIDQIISFRLIIFSTFLFTCLMLKLCLVVLAFDILVEVYSFMCLDCGMHDSCFFPVLGEVIDGFEYLLEFYGFLDEIVRLLFLFFL
jgi:hypothetical protein